MPGFWLRLWVRIAVFRQLDHALPVVYESPETDPGIAGAYLRGRDKIVIIWPLVDPVTMPLSRLIDHECVHARSYRMEKMRPAAFRQVSALADEVAAGDPEISSILAGYDVQGITRHDEAIVRVVEAMPRLDLSSDSRATLSSLRGPVLSWSGAVLMIGPAMLCRYLGSTPGIIAAARS